MKGKLVVITGGNSGIGFQTAKDLAMRGARVIIGCRNEERGITAREKIRRDTKNPDVHYINLVLASLESVREFATKVSSTEKRVDVLINNAGAFGLGYKLTKDGIVEVMQVNYFGPFLLTMLLLPLLEQSDSGRIINVTSVLHYFGWINFGAINEENSYNDWRSYANSKLCITTFTVELAKRLKNTKLTVNCVHPGIIKTRITRHFNTTNDLLFSLWCWICYRTEKEGAQTILYLAVSEKCATTTGKFFVDCQTYFLPPKAKDKTTGQRLWDYSKRIANIDASKMPRTIRDT